jgi:hypothetical protein
VTGRSVPKRLCRYGVHQDGADLAAGGVAPLYPGFIPGGSVHAGEQLMRRPWSVGRRRRTAMGDPDRLDTPDRDESDVASGA